MKIFNLNTFLKLQLTALVIISILLINSCRSNVPSHSQEYYQLKIYNLTSEAQVTVTENFLKNAYLPALHRTGIPKVGVFKPIQTNDDGEIQLFVWTPFKSLEQFNELQNVLKKDVQFQTDGNDYINAVHDNPPYQRIESILLHAFSEMPQFGDVTHNSPKDKRVYELRSYHAATERLLELKVEMFNEGGEVKIFKDLGFNPLFFGEVISGSAMPNLMYMSTFENKDSQTKHWEAFSNNPDWEKLKSVSKYNNTVSHIDKYLLYPTDYSDI